MLYKAATAWQIADDLIVRGADLEEHDRNLYTALERLRESGLTLNGGKCLTLTLHKLTFFGHDLSSEVVGPNEEKIAAVVNAQLLQNVSEVRPTSAVFIQVHSQFLTSCRTSKEVIEEGTNLHLGPGATSCI